MSATLKTIQENCCANWAEEFWRRYRVFSKPAVTTKYSREELVSKRKEFVEKALEIETNNSDCADRIRLLSALDSTTLKGIIDS